MLETLAYTYVKNFERLRDGRIALLALKQQFGGEA
jgi:hypothetical protein